MGRKGERLFDLVKNLDPVEIRDVYQYAGAQGKEKNHMRLFAVLCRMEQYDDALIEKEFAGESVLNHLSRLKNYLHTFIFKALAAYYRQPNADLEEVMRQAVIAANKGKIRFSLDLIDKAKEMARERELFSEWLSLLKKERQLLLRLPDLEGLEERLDLIRDEIVSVTQMLDNLNQYEAIEDDIIKRARLKYLKRGIRDREFLQKIEKEPLIHPETTILSERARLKYLHIRFELSRGTGDYKACITQSAAAAALIEKHKFLQTENPGQYFRELARLGTALLAVNQTEAARTQLEKLSAQVTQSKLEEILLQKNLIPLQLSFANLTGETDYGHVAVATLEERYHSFFPEIADEENILLHWLVIKFYFESEQLFKASSWIHRHFNQSLRKVRADLEVAIRVFHLLILFEQSDWEGIDYYSRRHLRYMKGLEKANKFERSLIRFLKKVPDYLLKDNLTEGMIKFREELEVIFEDAEERYALHYFNIMAWLDKRIKEHTHISLH